MHLRLTFPSGDVRLPHVLHPGFEFGYLFFEASSSSLLRVSFSPEWSSVREKSVGWFSYAVQCVAKCRQRAAQAPRSWSSLQSILGREPKWWSLLQEKKTTTTTHKTQWLWDCSSPSLYWADAYGSIDIESWENCSAKNIQMPIYNDRSW